MEIDPRVAETEAALKAEGITLDDQPEVQSGEAKAEAKAEPVQAELNDFEQDQKAKGWNPDGPKSAEEWARAKPLYDELKTRGKELKQLRRTVDELKEHMQKQEKVAYEKALKDLQAQRVEAIQSGDVERVQEIDKAQADLPQVNDTPPAVIDFQERHNEWLTSPSFEHMQMREWVTKRDNELAQYNLSPEEHMKTLEEHLHKQFPDKFGEANPNPEQHIPAVESGSGDNVAAKRGKKTFRFRDLDTYQKQAAKDFERLGVMAVEDYIKQLVDAGELK